MHVPKLTLRTFNHLLTGVIVIFAAYIVLAPFLPAITWWTQHQAPIISKPPSIATPVAKQAQPPKDNILEIPSIGLQQIIHEGQSKYTLHYGVWHRPASSNPSQGGNTVLAGHRFTYHDPAVFYNLDKVKVGDTIHLYWQQKQYTYIVQQTLTVPPTDVAVEAPTSTPTLTIYTCTPLWTSKYRLVLVASLEAS